MENKAPSTDPCGTHTFKGEVDCLKGFPAFLSLVINKQ